MFARYLLPTFLSCTLSATLPSQILSRQTNSSATSITTTPSHCFNPPYPRTHVYPAYLLDCEHAAARILRNGDPFTAVTFSHVLGSGFQLPVNYRYQSCSISLNIDPGQSDFFQPRKAYLAAWELAWDCTSGMHQFGGWRTVGPKDKVVVLIVGVRAQEGALAEASVENATTNFIADD